jgi:hypothetical protein
MSPATEAVKSCLECGADNPHFANHCWMCGGDLKDAPLIAVAVAGSEAKPELKPNAKPAWAGDDSADLILVGTLTGLVLLVGMGVYASERALVIPFAIGATPALLATYIRATRKRIQKKPIGILGTLATFVISFVVSTVVGVAILIVLAAAMMISLINTCFAELSKH